MTDLTTCCDAGDLTLTQKVLLDVVTRIGDKIHDMAVEFFPDKPAHYVLNHVQGAFLVSYASSQFSKPQDTTAVVQQRDLHIDITLMLRELNGRTGAVAMLDRLRLALIGFTPKNCRRRLYAVKETMLGERDGVWMYQTTFATETMQIED